MHLTEQEQQQINRLVAEVEAASGAQLVVAVVAKSDTYPEIPWKAFALGVATAGTLIAVAGLLHTDWSPRHAVALATMILLGCGMTFGAATIFVPALARLFLDDLRAALEVRQYAHAMFLDRGIFQTQGRVGVLILMSLFERRAAIVADAGVREYLTDAQVDAVSAKMIPLLATGQVAAAAEMGLRTIEQLLRGKLDRSAHNALADTLVQECGS